jgi:proline-specific peptidase
MASTAKSGLVEVKGFKLYYEIHGSHESKTTLLTLHGGPGFTHHQLLPLRKLSERKPPVRIVFYDQLGCGRSERTSDFSNYVISRAVDEVEEVRTALGLGEICLLGHSYGGSLALEYALKYPSNLRKLILSSSDASIPETIKAFSRLKSAMPKQVREILEKYEAIGDYDNPEYKKAVEELYRRHVYRGTEYPPDLAASLNGFNPDVYWTMWGKHEFICTGNMRDWDVTERLGKIRAPTLILVGRHDELPVELSEEMHKRIPHSTLVVLEKSSHFGMFEEEQRYLDAVYGFLTETQN